MKPERNLSLESRRRLHGARSVARISGYPCRAVASRLWQSPECSPDASSVPRRSRLASLRAQYRPSFRSRDMSLRVASRLQIKPHGAVRSESYPSRAVASWLWQSIVCWPSTLFVPKVSRVALLSAPIRLSLLRRVRVAPMVAAQRGVAVRSGISVPNKSLEPTPVRNAPSLSLSSGAAQLGR